MPSPAACSYLNRTSTRDLHPTRLCLSYNGFFFTSSGDEGSRVLPFRLFFRDSLEKLGKEFGVGEFLDLLELQAPVFVGDYVSNQNHLAVHVHPE